MANKRKTRDRWDVMVDYGGGWRHVVSAYNQRAAWLQYKSYAREVGAENVKLKKYREPLKEEKPPVPENETLEETLERLEWEYHWSENGNCLKIHKDSPAGEDFWVVINPSGKRSFEREIFVYAEEFDVDEHVDGWASERGKGGCPSTYRELVEDAEAIQKMLDELADALMAPTHKPTYREG